MASATHTGTQNDRRSRTRDEIKRLIEDRNSVLSQYYNLAKYSEDTEADPNNTLELLDEFCQELVDYMATGHFEIYRRIEEGNERRDEIIRLADKIMPRINDTTQIAVAFNDIYDHSEKIDEATVKKLPNYLAKLGEELATRIELEDQFIDAILTSNTRPTLSPVSS
ncbi:MAG: Rsd/AlgQ family anti-sigma factor [Gammaproteobacteria bacterium]|nr:Rsd/AlgQ family anti-sigma factor [Gammaproteobacteria bacterium]